MESWKLSRLIIIIWRYTWEQLVASCNCRLASCGDEREEEKKKKKEKRGEKHARMYKCGSGEGGGKRREEARREEGRVGGGWKGYIFSGIRVKLKSRRAERRWRWRYGGEGGWRGMKGFEVAIARNSRFARLRASAETAICIGNYTGWITPRNERSVLRVIGAHYKSRDERIARHLHSVWGSDGWYHVVTGRGGADGGRSFSKGGGEGDVDFCLRESFRDNLSSR